jgi:hypothetical protein
MRQIGRLKLNGRRFMAAVEARKLTPKLHGVTVFDYGVH